ncbi:MAG: S41 family peptidase [Alistipes sp.]|nr:S41 family peptidase [Alistipes sp.]
MNRSVKYSLIGLFLVALFATGIFATRNDFGLGRNMEIVVNLMRELSVGYVDEVSPDEMMKSAAKGITQTLDPYTTYLPEEEMKDFATMTTGKYGGIGSLIRQDSNYVRIAEPYKGSPADRAGLQIGDKILSIDGENAEGFTVEDVSSRLRGEPNTTVRLTIQSLVSGEVSEKKLRRERISIPSISYAGYVAEGVGYIRHADFTEGCYEEMRAAIERLQKQGELKSLILDYRNNGGGVMQSAVKVLSLFLPKGSLVVETKGRTSRESDLYRTEYEPLLPNTPLTVLINGNSASAAEIVAGALQDNDRAVLLGQRSFGKGLVQSTRALGYNSYVKMTTAKYYIPSGRCIQAVRYSSDGRAESMPDSLVGEFRTVAGRKVYDGGGIMPDVKLKPKYVSSFAATLYLLGVIDDFGDDYFKRHHTQTISPRTFCISDADYEDFKQMVAERNIPYQSESRKALERLRSALKSERYDEGMAEALKSIEQRLKDDKASNLETFRKEITDAINADIVLRFAYSEGMIENSLDNDREIQQAIKLLDNKVEYERILREQDTQRK